MIYTNVVGRFTALLALLFTFKFDLVYGGGFMYLSVNGTKPNNTMAQTICKSYGSCDLAVVDSQAEYDRLMQYFNRTLGTGFTLPAAVWIGLYWTDVTGLGNYSHVWETANSKMQLTWAKWDGGEPNALGTDNCVRIHTNFFFRSINCDGSYDILCEGIGQSSCSSGQTNQQTTECKLLAKCWWTPARIGLAIGFSSLFTLFCVVCVGWKCFCAPKTQVGYDIGDEDDDDAIGERKNGIHNIMKNHNIDQSPVDTSSQSSRRLHSGVDTSWMSPEEQSFSARYSYKH